MPKNVTRGVSEDGKICPVRGNFCGTPSTPVGGIWFCLIYKGLINKAPSTNSFKHFFCWSVGMPLAYTTLVFHRILDLKTGWISIRAFFFAHGSAAVFLDPAN
jgi:hypothetical protein